jgi:hypothetical protein
MRREDQEQLKHEVTTESQFASCSMARLRNA